MIWSPSSKDRRAPGRVDRRRQPALAGHLELLAEMSGHFVETLDVEATIRKALELIVRYVNAEAGSLFLLDDDGALLTCRACVGPVDITGVSLQPEQGIVGHCVAANRSRMVLDTVNDPEFSHVVDDSTGFVTRSILCAPLSVQEERIGGIELLNKRDGIGLFSEHDLMMLQTLASAAALAIHNAHMTGQLVRQERLNREIELAVAMQRSLLPAPRPAPFPVCGLNLPAYEFSGDFYDFFELDDGRLCFALGDVSGKGLDAALLMSKTASLFRCLGKSVESPGELLGVINRELCETAIRGMFVTMVCGILEPQTGEVVLANAGHEPPLIHRSGDAFAVLPASGPPLGIIPFVPGDDGIREEHFELKGGRLYLFSDGVTEATLADGGHLGQSGLKKLVVAQSGNPAEAVISAVVSCLEGDGVKRHDDITLLTVG